MRHRNDRNFLKIKSVQHFPFHDKRPVQMFAALDRQKPFPVKGFIPQRMENGLRNLQ